MKEAEDRDRIEMRSRLDVWDDDESDELFYTDRPRWRAQRARRLAAEQAADEESRLYEEREAENLRRESEAFLARQMDEMQALQEEQRKAGMLLDDGAPVRGVRALRAVRGRRLPELDDVRRLRAPREGVQRELVRRRFVHALEDVDLPARGPVGAFGPEAGPDGAAVGDVRGVEDEDAPDGVEVVCADADLLYHC